MTADASRPPEEPIGHPLDDAVRSSLAGAHAGFATWRGRVARYHPEVTGFFGHPESLDAQDWADLASLAGPGAPVALRGEHPLPRGWTVLQRLPVAQLAGPGLRTAPDPEAVPLGSAHVAAMLDLVERTQPGPFRPRTHQMGTYLGFLDGDRLIAMAGERLHPRGWTEISAVCTDPRYRGRGLATRLIRAVGHGIRARGELPFLHSRADNHGAIALYHHLGFETRKITTALAVRTPGDPPPT